MLSRGFAEPARVRRKLVPEAIEIDTLAPGDQALHVGAAKAEMPQQWVLEKLLPGPDPRQWRIDQHESLDPFGMQGGKGEPNHVADVVRDEIDLLDPQRGEHPRHVARLGFLVESTAGFRGKPQAPEIGDDHPVVPGEIDGQGRPHVAGLGITVEQHHRRPRAAYPSMDGDTVGGDFLCLEATREGEVRHLIGVSRTVAWHRPVSLRARIVSSCGAGTDPRHRLLLPCPLRLGAGRTRGAPATAMRADSPTLPGAAPWKRSPPSQSSRLVEQETQC